MPEFYLNNPNLKSKNVSIQYTQEQIEEYLRCKEDPVYFIKKYCKIVSLDHGLINFDLYDYQIRFVNAIHENNRVISMQPRQSGKTQTVAAYLLHYVSFEDNKTVAILANKATAAREIMSRFQLMYEYLPNWLQQGIVTWNKGDIELENGSKVFTAATAASSIRGKSCVTSDTKVCILENDAVYYTEIDKIINNSIFVNIDNYMKKYTVYKTTNLVNNKVYIGFHSIKDSDILRMNFGNLSCFKDGYLGSGKLIIKAIEKYGPENFAQEILGVFDSKSDAEDLERSLVSEDFVEMDDNYNMTIGGNVTILCGEKNGFYGKQHSEETLYKIRSSRTSSNLPTYQCVVVDKKTKVEFKGYSAALQHYGYINSNTNNENQKRIFLGELVFNNVIDISNKEFSDRLVDYYLNHKNITSEDHVKAVKEVQSKICKERFIGFKQTEEHIKKRINSHKEWIKNNPELHKSNMDLINKNPEKIRKTADKHRGMKRSDETRKNISNSLKGRPSSNKNKFMAYNPQTLESGYFKDINELPLGWIKGAINANRPSGKKSFTNGEDFKMYYPGQEPYGWYLGGAKKTKK